MNNRDNTSERTITWNAEKDFLVKYRFLMEKVRHGEQTAYYKVKELRTMEFHNTIEIVNQGHYTTESGKHVFFPSDKEMMSKTVFYEHEFHVPDAPQNNEPTIVEIQNIDCLYAGVQLKERIHPRCPKHGQPSQPRGRRDNWGRGTGGDAVP